MQIRLFLKVFEFINHFLLLSLLVYSIDGLPIIRQSKDLSDFIKKSKNEINYFFYEKEIKVSPLEIQIEAQISKKQNKFGYFIEIIFAKILNKENFDEDELHKNSYIMRFTLSNDVEGKDFLQIIKCMDEAKKCLGNETRKIKLNLLKAISYEDIYYDLLIVIDDYGFKIISKNVIVFEEKIKLKNYFGEEFYAKVVHSKEGISFNKFLFKISSNKTKELRFLEEEKNNEENEGGKFDYLEMDPLNIVTEPNYLREGDIYAIPSVIINPKDEKGNFPSDIKNVSLWKKNNLKKLLNVTHSRDADFKYEAIFKKNQLVFSFETKIPGELYLTSKYFKSIDRFIIKIKNGVIVPENSRVLRIKNELMPENYIKFNIILKDKYEKPIQFLEQSDIDELEMKIKYPNNDTKIEDMEFEFDPESNGFILNKTLTMPGETTFLFSFNNQSIDCDNCTFNLEYGEFDLNSSNVTYTKEIELGENINLSFSPKDKYNNTIPAKEILDKLEINCTINTINNSTKIKINSSLNEENNMIELTNGEIITQPGNLSLFIIYDDQKIEYQINIIEKTILNETKFYLIANTSIEEIINNNSIVTLDVKDDFEILVNLVNFYGNELQIEDDSTIISEAKLYGNDMDIIFLNKTRKDNKFYLTIHENNTEDFRYLVSGENYTIQIQLLKDNETIDFYFGVNLTSPENDEGYGNGIYNISHFIIEPNETLINMSAGVKYSFILQVKTEKDLLYHRELDINNHLNYSLSLEDKSFIFNVSNNDSKLGIFLIEIYSTIQGENDLTLVFDEKNLTTILIKIGSSNLPSAKNSEIVNYTKEISQDIEPIIISIILRDDYNNEFIDKKDIMFKKQLFVLIGDEKPEQNIEMGPDNKTFILNFVSDYHKELLNLTIAFNNSNDLIEIANNIIVTLKVKEFLEPESLVIPIQYKPGKIFLYRIEKKVEIEFEIEDEKEKKKSSLMSNGNFFLYIRDINYEKGENNTKIALYTGYLAILALTNKNETLDEQYFIYDKNLIDIYNQTKNGSEVNSFLPLIENTNETIGFIKIQFYENGNIKQIYYPKMKNFSMLSLEYINELAGLIIPKISSHLFIDDIYKKLDEILKDNKIKTSNDDSQKEGRMRFIRRLSELTPKNRKKISKKRKSVMRILDENSTTENLFETEILPSEKDIDIQLRQIEKNNDNSNNITLVSYEDVYNEKAKLIGSLDNKEVYTKINDKGMISSIYESQITEMVSNVKNEAQDKYIKDTAYANTTFDEEIFKIENETEIQDSLTIKLNSMNSNNTNLINLMDDFSDDNGTLIEYFSSIEYELFNDSVYENYLLEEMGTEYLDSLNISNLSMIIEDYDDNTNSLRELLSYSDYPYYGQDITRNIKDVYNKEILGMTIKKYVETSVYPHNGITTIDNVFVIGSQKRSISKKSIHSNNHILIKNKNSMTNQLVIYLSNINLKYEQFKDNIRELYDKYKRNINDLGMEFNSLNKSFDWFKSKFEGSRNELSEVLKDNFNSIEVTISSLDNTFDELYEQIAKNLYDANDYFYDKIRILYLSWKDFAEKAREKILSPEIRYDDLLIIYEICDDLESKYSEIKKKILEILEQSIDNINNYIQSFFSGIIYNNNFYRKEFKIKGKNIIEEIENSFYENLDSTMINFLSKIRQYFSGSEMSSFITRIDNINKDSFYINIEDKLNDLENILEKNIYELKEEKINELNENRPSYISGITSMKKDLDYVYDKINHDFFDFYKYISDELYSRLKNVKYSLFDDLVEIKNKLSNYSDSMFKYMNLSVEDLDNYNVDSIKENFILILKDYNKTLSDYAYGMNDNFLRRRFSLFDFGEYIDKMENNLQEFIKTMNISTDNYLEPPKNLIDALDFYFILLNKTYEKMTNIQSNFEETLMRYFFINIFISIQNYLMNFVTKDFEGQLSLINNKTSFFYSETMVNERELFNKIYEDCKNNAGNIIINKFTRLYNTESIKENFYDFNSALNRLESLGKYSEMKDSLKEKINNTYNPNNAIIYQNESEKIEYLINYNFIKTLMNYTNSFAENLNNILNDEDKKDFIIDEKYFDYIEELYDKNKIEKIKKSIFNYNNNYQEKSNAMCDVLAVKIQSFLSSYELNYSEIATEYTKIIEWDDITFIDYLTNYLNGIVDSIYSLIDEYAKNLYSSLKYPYNFENSGFQKIKSYFENLKNEIINEFTFSIEEFENNFKKRNNEILIERKNDFLNILKPNNSNENDFEVEIGKNKFNTYNYIINKMNEIDDLYKINELIEISNADLTQFKSEIEKIYKNHSQIISEKLSEETENFLNSFEKNKSNDFLTIVRISIANNVKKNYKSCYDIRGLFLSQITVLDEQNLQAYKSYNYTMSIIEERCKVNGVLDEENCIYDLSDIEPFEYKELRPIYDECMNKGVNTHYLGYSYLESSEDFDLSTITSIFNKIKKKIKKYISFEKIITNYIYNKYNINWYKKNKINLNITELNEIIQFENHNLETNYIEFIREKFLSLFVDIYYVEYGNSKFNNIKSDNLLLLSQLKKTFYQNIFINGYGYKEHKNYYLEILPKIKSLDPFLKEKLSNFTNEVDEKQNSFFQNWEEKLNTYISNYFNTDKINIKILNNFYRLVKKNFIDEWNMSYIQENFDIIMNNTLFNANFTQYILFSYYKEYKISSSSIIDEEGTKDDENNLQAQINDILDKIESKYIYSEKAMELLNSFKTKDTIDFNQNTNIDTNDAYTLNKLNDFVYSFIDECPRAYNLTILDSIYNKTIKAQNDSEFDSNEFDKFFENFVKDNDNTFKQIINETNQIYKKINPLLSEVEETLIEGINEACRNMIGYTMIDGFNYVEEPCKGLECSYKANLPKFSDIINNGRRLEEKDYIKDLKKAISNMKEKIHNSKDFKLKFSEDKSYNKRKLEFTTFELNTPYTQRSGARDESHVNITLSYLKNNLEKIIDELYDIVKQLRAIDYTFFYSRLEELRETTLTFINGYSKQSVDIDKFNELKNYLTKTFNKISNYITKRANTIISNHKKAINKLKDQYLYFSLLKDYIYDFTLIYYRNLNDIISTKSVSYREDEKYNTKIDETQLENDMKSNSEMLYSISQKFLTLISTIKKESLGEERKLEEDDDENDTFDLGNDDFGDYDENPDGSLKKGFIPIESDDDDDENDDNEKKSLEDKLDDAEIEIETEIKIEFKSWTEIYFSSKTSGTKEWGWDDHFGWQFPLAFPGLPLFQFRCGFKFEIYIKLVFGLELIFNKKEDGFSFDFRVLLDFSLGVKVNVIAEVGVYAGIASISGGIEGSIFDARAGIRLYNSFKDSYTDLYIYLILNAFQFSIFVKGEVKIAFWKVKVTLFERDFALIKDDLLNCKYYIRFNWFKEWSEPISKCE